MHITRAGRAGKEGGVKGKGDSEIVTRRQRQERRRGRARVGESEEGRGKK
jgi:hypothetical protein